MSGGFFKDNLTTDSDLLEEQARDAADRAEAARDRAETADTNVQSALASANSSAAGAAVSAQNASDSEQAAAASAQSASTDAATAASAISSTQAARDAAIGSRDTAIAQASLASTSASESSASAVLAAASETAASASETAAAASEVSSAASQAASLASQNAASASAAAALVSENAASASEIAALGYKNDTQAIKDATQVLLDAFGDQYLGSFTSAPTVDNSGAALTEGDIYWDETNNLLKFWDGSSWVSPETVANNYATAAQNSATAAASSEVNAAASEVASAASEAASSISEGNAQTYAANASASAISAANAISSWTSSTAYGITTGDVSNWNTAYGWGDHSAAGYLTSFTETNDLSSAVTWANVPDANITQTSVTQHQAALSITNSQVTGLGTSAALDVGTGANNVVQLDGTGALPAVDGSNLTNVSSVANLNDLTDVNTTGVTDGQVIAYDATAGEWQAADQASAAGTFTTYKYTATDGQTVFTGADDDTNSLLINNTGSIIVTLNGITLENGTDYTATTSSVTLTPGATTDDEVNISAFNTFDVATYTQFPFFKASGGAGNIDLTGFNSIRFFKADGTASNIALG